jgi:hypothetical protein
LIKHLSEFDLESPTKAGQPLLLLVIPAQAGMTSKKLLIACSFVSGS